MNCSTRTLTTVLALGAFAVTGVAQAAPAKPSVSAGSGVLKGSSVAFTVNNRSAYEVSGKVAAVGLQMLIYLSALFPCLACSLRTRAPVLVSDWFV